MSEANFGQRAFFIVVMGMLCRAAVVVHAEQRPAHYQFPDTSRYLAVARNIAAGHGPIESDLVRAGTDPLYPALISVGVLIGLESDAQLLRFGRLINICAAGISIGLLAWIGRTLFSPVVGWTGAGMLAFDPIMNFFAALVLTETVFVMLLLAGSAALVEFRQIRAARWVLGAGALFGFGILTRSSSLLLPVLLAPLVWYSSHVGGHRRVAHVVMFIAAAGVVLLPTLIRNYGLFGHLVPVRTGTGASLMEALGPWADGGPGMDRIVYPPMAANAGEFQRNRICRAAALDWVRVHPGATLSLAWTKLRRTWSITINASAYSSPFYVLLAWLTVAPVFLFAVAGLWLRRRETWCFALLISPAVYFSIVHMVFVGSVRYRVPAMPFVFLFAGSAVEALWQKYRYSRTI